MTSRISQISNKKKSGGQSLLTSVLIIVRPLQMMHFFSKDYINVAYHIKLSIKYKS